MEIIQADWYAIEDINIQDDTQSITHEISRKTSEILDIYTEYTTPDGKKIYTKKRQMEREKAHKIGALHTGAQIWVYNSKGQVLLQKRANGIKSSPGLFDTSASGHIKGGETIISGGLAELRQEIGLIAKDGDLVHIGNYRRETRKMAGKELQYNNEINKVFLLQYEGGLDALKRQRKEVSELKFTTLEQLEEDWNNPQTLALYTSKGEQYRQMVLKNIKKVLGRIY